MSDDDVIRKRLRFWGEEYVKLPAHEEGNLIFRFADALITIEVDEALLILPAVAADFIRGWMREEAADFDGEFLIQHPPFAVRMPDHVIEKVRSYAQREAAAVKRGP